MVLVYSHNTLSGMCMCWCCSDLIHHPVWRTATDHNQCLQNGRTALWWASHYGNAMSVTQLLAVHGIDVNGADEVIALGLLGSHGCGGHGSIDSIVLASVMRV
jgi:hypothetical protein